MQTTLNKIKSHDPCEGFWNKLLNHLGKTESDDEVLELRTILESNGVNDTLWAFRAVDGKDKEIRLFAADCAELVLPIFEKQFPHDDRPRKAIQAARDYANGLIGVTELNDAWNAAKDSHLVAEKNVINVLNSYNHYCRRVAWSSKFSLLLRAQRDREGFQLNFAKQAAMAVSWITKRVASSADAFRDAGWAAGFIDSAIIWDTSKMDSIKSLLIKYI